MGFGKLRRTSNPNPERPSAIYTEVEAPGGSFPLAAVLWLVADDLSDDCGGGCSRPGQWQAGLEQVLSRPVPVIYSVSAVHLCYQASSMLLESEVVEVEALLSQGAFTQAYGKASLQWRELKDLVGDPLATRFLFACLQAAVYSGRYRQGSPRPHCHPINIRLLATYFSRPPCSRAAGCQNWKPHSMHALEASPSCPLRSSPCGRRQGPGCWGRGWYRQRVAHNVTHPYQLPHVQGSAPSGGRAR